MRLVFRLNLQFYIPHVYIQFVFILSALQLFHVLATFPILIYEYIFYYFYSSYDYFYLLIYLFPFYF